MESIYWTIGFCVFWTFSLTLGLAVVCILVGIVGLMVDWLRGELVSREVRRSRGWDQLPAGRFRRGLVEPEPMNQREDIPGMGGGIDGERLIALARQQPVRFKPANDEAKNNAQK